MSLDKSPHDFDDKLKARIAIEALEGERTLDELSGENNVPVELIKEWIENLKRNADQIFKGGVVAGAHATDNQDSDNQRRYLSLLKAAFNAMVNGILVIDTSGKIVTYNDQFVKMWDIPKSMMEQGEDDKIINYVLDQLENPQEFVTRINELYQNPSEVSFDVIKFKDGKIFERYSFPQRIDDEIVGRVWSFMDVTEQKKAQRKISRFAELLKSINANIEQGVIRSTPEQGLIYVNQAFVDMFGYDTKEEVYNTDPKEFYYDQQKRKKLVSKLKREGHFKNEEVVFKRKGGSTFWGLETSNLIKTEHGTFIDGLVNDITERKKVEEALRQSEEKYRTIIENIEDGYFETNLEGDFTFFNESLREMIGYSENELMGMNNREYMDEENAAKVYKVFNKVYTTGEAEKGYEWEIINKSSEKRFVEASVSLKKDSNSNPVGFRGIVRDITDRKRHEERMKASLKEKEVLLGEIHHRVKNNLAVISGLLYMQLEKTEDESARKLLEQSQSRIHSMALIHEMLYDTKSFSRIDPEQYIRQLVKFISKNLSTDDKHISTRFNTGDIKLDMNIAIPCALIINELLTNAYKYAFEDRREGTILVEFDKKGDNYYLKVEDDGVGMPESIDTEDLSDKSGLGLFLVETLTKQIKGELDIDQNGGTTITITFPVHIES